VNYAPAFGHEARRSWPSGSRRPRGHRARRPHPERADAGEAGRGDQWQIGHDISASRCTIRGSSSPGCGVSDICTTCRESTATGTRCQGAALVKGRGSVFRNDTSFPGITESICREGQRARADTGTTATPGRKLRDRPPRGFASSQTTNSGPTPIHSGSYGAKDVAERQTVTSTKQPRAVIDYVRRSTPTRWTAGSRGQPEQPW